MGSKPLYLVVPRLDGGIHAEAGAVAVVDPRVKREGDERGWCCGVRFFGKLASAGSRDLIMNEELELYDRIVAALGDGRYDADHHKSRSIALDLLRMVKDQLDEENLRAVEVAERFEAGSATDEERLEWLCRIGRKREDLQKRGYGSGAAGYLSHLDPVRA